MTSDEHSRDATAGSASGPVPAEVLDGWRSELEEFFSEIRTRLSRLAESAEHVPAAASAPPQHRESPPQLAGGEKGDGGHMDVVRGESPSITSLGATEATAREEPDRPPPESPSIDGSLERLQEIKRQLAARLGKS